MSQRNIDRTNWLGVCLLVIGIAYLNRNLHWDFFHINQYLPHYFFSWQAILIGVGFLLLLFGRGIGVVLMLVGAFFLFTKEAIYAISHVHQWWPIALIIVGVAMLVKSRTIQKG